jgi:hypothetical protein
MCSTSWECCNAEGVLTVKPDLYVVIERDEDGFYVREVSLPMLNQ